LREAYGPTGNGERPVIPPGGFGGSCLAPKIDPSEVRSVDPDTGGEKGVKLARFDLIPTKALFELAEHYGKGCKKYSENNWRKGLSWSKSYAALQRHITAFWGGEDFDEDTGSKHVIAVAWHCLTLATYMDEQRAKDDRYKLRE